MYQEWMDNTPIFGKIKDVYIKSVEKENSMIDKCSKCESENLFVEIQGSRRGLYCGNCGKWQKWITKEELQVAKFKGLKIIEDK